ncbi:hypothetical protein [Lentzea aerocolonigenes]|uniref:hypothetical protein n=1 Tax=Lentzea aerocolonigenes TaxID=68170 RepID=UPI0012E183C1|nr:hypothetical protein [Lentzea aerocolonigenes]
MGAGQVSIWVPLVVGVIGLAGVICGQLINAWREDRRWKREQEREDLRWQREQEKNDTEREHRNMLDWRDRKIEIYSELLGAFKECEYAALETDSFRYVVDGGEAYYSAHDFQARLSGATERFRATAQKVTLIASSELRARIFSPPSENSVVYYIGEEGRLVSPAELRRFAENIRDNREAAIAIMREELGSKDETIWSQMFRR